MTDQSKIAKMRSEANRELNGMKFKKATVIRNINKCLKLVEVCRRESQIGNSPLLKQLAEDLIVHYNRTQGSLRELEERMEKFLSLSSHTHDDDNEDDLQELIDESLAAIEVYSTLNPIQIARASARPIQAAPQNSMPGRFKLNSDLRPNLLVKDFTLREVNIFSEAFSNYMQSSPN